MVSSICLSRGVTGRVVTLLRGLSVRSICLPGWVIGVMSLPRGVLFLPRGLAVLRICLPKWMTLRLLVLELLESSSQAVFLFLHSPLLLVRQPVDIGCGTWMFGGGDDFCLHLLQFLGNVPCKHNIVVIHYSVDFSFGLG